MFMTRSTVLVLQYDLPNGHLASQNFTNLFGHTNYLNLNLVSYDVPELNLVFQMSDVRYEIKNFVTCYLTWLDWKSGSVRLNEHEHKLILVLGWSGRWWRCWRDRPTNWSSKRLTMCDLKKWKNINIHRYRLIIDHHFFTYFTLAWQSNYQIFNVITD